MLIARRHLLLLAWPLAAGLGVPARAASRSRTLGSIGQGLEQFALGGPPCVVDASTTRSVARSEAFRAGSPARRSLMDPETPAGIPLTFTGTVSGVTCGRIAGARVDVWHADSKGAFDMTGYRLRGNQLTDAQGQFRFTTVMPGGAGRRAPHIGVHVTVPGKAELSTELFFPDEPRNAKDDRFHSTLLMKSVPEGRSRRVHFDIVLGI